MGKRKQSSEVGGQGSATTATQSKPTEVDERPALMRGIDTSSDKPYWEVGTENGGQSSENGGQRTEKRKSMVELFESMNKKPKSIEERYKEAKRNRNKAIVNALFDGISAISNIVTTSRYGNNMYTGQNTQSATQAKEWEKRKAKADDYERAYNNSWLSAYFKDADLEIANKKAAADAADKAWNRNYKVTKLEQDAQAAADKLEEAKRHNKAMEDIGVKRANKPSGGKRSTVYGANNGYPVFNEKGEIISYVGRKESAYAQSIANGYPAEQYPFVSYDSETEDQYGGIKTTRKEKRISGGGKAKGRAKKNVVL